jgi:hypothetical protein
VSIDSADAQRSPEKIGNGRRPLFGSIRQLNPSRWMLRCSMPPTDSELSAIERLLAQLPLDGGFTASPRLV